MKKLLLLFGMLLTVGMFSSCTKTEIQYRDFFHNNISTVNFRVDTRNWIRHENNFEKYYYYTFDNVAEITPTIVANNGVNASMIINNVVVYPLPDSHPFEDVVDGESFIYTRIVSYEYQNRSITFKVKSSDFNFSDDDLETMNFRVQITTPNF